MATSSTSEKTFLTDNISEVCQKLRKANLDQPNDEMIGTHILTQPVEKDREFLRNKEVFFCYFVQYVNLYYCEIIKN